jgi:hypothetical protein
VYLDDIIIYLNDLSEHMWHIKLVMERLRINKLYCNKKKMHFFLDEIVFLGHKISCQRIEACNDKVSKILAWPRPKCATDVCAFLGLM